MSSRSEMVLSRKYVPGRFVFVHHHSSGNGNGSINQNPDMVEQLTKQLEHLKDKDTSSVIRMLREHVDDMEKEHQQQPKSQHHHHHQQQRHQQQQHQHHPSERRTEEKGCQADWMLLLETEAELINRPQRLSVPDLTRPRQRIGSKSHSVDDDDAAPTSDDDAAKGRQDESMAEELRQANERLLAARLREANLLAHLKDYRSRAEDLRRMISLRESTIQRLEDEIMRLKDALVEGRGKEKEMQSFISDLQLTLDDLHSKYEEYVVLGQLRDAEHANVVQGLEQQIARLQEEALGVRMHRSVDNSPSTKRCVRYKDTAMTHSRSDIYDTDDDSYNSSQSSAVTHRSSLKPDGRKSGNYSAGQSPSTTRRGGILNDKTSANMRSSSSFCGRSMMPEREEEHEENGAIRRRVSHNDLRKAAATPTRANNIPPQKEHESETHRTRPGLVRKASYIYGIQHSVLDDLTDAVD